MLTDRTIEKLNDQIQEELRTVDSICSSQQDKMEALERIAKLKELLTPQPSRQDIISELATALKNQTEPTRTPSPSESIVESIFTAFRR